MNSSETRIRLVHERANEMQRELDRKKMYQSAVTSCALCIGLLVALGQFDLRSVMYSGSLLTGSSLLSESVGGYVLVGIIAFMLGVIITVIIKKHLDQTRRRSEERQHGKTDQRKEDDIFRD
jgi:hypothetical protein